ncbi:MAG: c-type cytochrome [Chloroflexi bacterium]|nr:c-type cytochrome [Chloroflexota bacterium]
MALLVVVGFLAFREEDNTSNNLSDEQTQEIVQMPHIHGLSFSGDGRQLIVPAHIGLVIFEDNQWSKPDIPAHDYMGYSGVDDGFFSSGHPGVDSDLVNPLGLVRSTDSGHQITTIDFAGETDFHFMAVGYENHAIYILNPQPSASLPAGLHYSLDEGETWQPGTLAGLEGSMTQIAVHPTNTSTVVIATQTGLFLSEDFGDTFTQIGDTGAVTAVSFHPSGDSLLFGNTRLYTYDFASQTAEVISSPEFVASDFIAFVATSPVGQDIAFATFGKDIYLSHDAGETWVQIAREGVGINSNPGSDVSAVESPLQDGQELYDLYCASCHGANGEGQYPENPYLPDASGLVGAPPHDSTGHTWHHPDAVLVEIVQEGRAMPNVHPMPPFKGQLSETQIMAILDHIKTWWLPEQVSAQATASANFTPAAP